MSWKTVGVAMVAVWLTLLTIEFFEDLGFIQYAQPKMDESVNTALAGLGEAIKISDDAQTMKLPPLHVQPNIAHSPFGANLPMQRVSLALQREPDLLNSYSKIHKFLQIFLI